VESLDPIVSAALSGGIVGGIVGLVGHLLTWRNTLRTLRNAQDIEARRARAATLQSYLEQMGTLVTGGRLRDPESTYVARAHTLAVLEGLDPVRKRIVLQFLRESNLISNENKIIDLSGANLRDADLSLLDLSAVALDGAILERANLKNAHLEEANLGGTYLSGADLTHANLHGASLINADLQRKAELVLDSADLSDANLTAADFRAADLRGANMRGAVLKDANFEGIVLREGAELKGADLRDAKGLTKGQLAQARGDAYTQADAGVRPQTWQQHREHTK
jgi:uncharacterized protein YjbI with pentapeptide repeats